MNVLRRKTVYH